MKINELAALVKGVVEGNGDLDIIGLSGFTRASAGDLVFAMDDERLSQAEESQCACILTTLTARASTKKALIRVTNPKFAFLTLYHVLYKRAPVQSFVHPSAVVADSVTLGANVFIGAGAVIEDNVQIAHDTVIESGVIIKKDSSVGAHCHLYPRVTLYEKTILKDKVVLHAGVVVGSDGFGYVRAEQAIYKFPQLGRVIIEDNVEIGSNSTIDRGSLDDTVIGKNAKIDNLCHIAHNVKIGKNFIMAAQSGIAGSTVIRDDVTISGQVAVTDNITIGNKVTIAGKSTVIGSIEDDMVVWGSPARPIAQTKRQMAVLSWLTKNFTSLSRSLKEKTSLPL